MADVPGPHQFLHVQTVLADGLQPVPQLRGDVGHFHHVAAEQGEVLDTSGLPVESSLLQQVQGGAGDAGEQSRLILQETDVGMSVYFSCTLNFGQPTLQYEKK